MPALDLRLLGGFRASRGASEVALPTRKASALLAYLAMPPGRPRSREELTALLWGERPEAQARTSFRQALATLRRTAGRESEPVVMVDHDAVLLNPAGVVVDVERFERFVGMGTPGALAEAAELYRGDFLGTLVVDEPGFDAWRTAQRERLHEVALEALGRMLALQIRHGHEGHAIQTALRLLELEPLQEAVHRTLMRLYVGQGRRAAALRQYRTCVESLRRDLGTQPERETQELHRRIVGREPLGADPLSSSGRRATSRAAGPRGAAGAPLVGRRAELARIDGALERAWSEGGRTLFVRGEAGVGKSRLLGELSAMARARGGRVLAGQGYETQQILPFRPWIDAIRAGQLRDADWLSALSAAACDRLTRLFPELLEGDALPLPQLDDPGGVFDAIVELLAYWSAREPLVVVLDDLQWADEMSLRLLAFVGARLTDSPVLLAASARDEEGDRVPLLGKAIEELSRSGRCEEIGLRPLGRAEAQRLIAALAEGAHVTVCPSGVVDRVWQLSEGNPFVIVESVRAIAALGAVPAATTLDLPTTVREFVAARLAQLSEIAQHLVSIAAVIGHESSVELLQRATALGPRDTADALDELARRRILEATADGFRFSHERVRQVAYERLQPARRALFHGAVGDALEQVCGDRLGEVADRLAHHSLHAGRHDKTITYLLRFADTARQRYALEDASAALRIALDHVEHLPAAGRDARRLEVLLRLSLLLALLGRFREIPALLLPHRQTVAALGLPAITGPYHVRLGLNHSYHAEYEAAREAATTALRAAEEAGDEATQGQARYLLALTAYWLGDAAASVTHAHEAIAILRRSGPPHYLGLTCWILGSSHCVLGDFDLALAAEAECDAIGVATSDARLRSFAALTTGWVLGMRGEFEAALAACRRSLEVARDPISVAGAKCFQGYTCVEMGAPGDAIPLLEDCLAMYARIGLRQSEARTLVFLSQANLALGKIDQAREQATRGRAMHEEMKAAWGRALAIQALGRIALASADLDRADAELHQAREMFAAVGAKFEVARTTVDLARLARARRRRLDACALLRQARDTFNAIGAPHHAERVGALAPRTGRAGLP